MNAENKQNVDLWMKQSQLFWQTVYQVPVIAGAMFAGWFALKSASQDLLAQGLLVVGFLSMLVQILVLKRMSQHLNAFRQAADRQIPSVPSALAGITGYMLGISTPVLIALFFVALLIWSPEFKKHEPQPPTTLVTKPSKSSLSISPSGVPASTATPLSSAIAPNPSLKGTPASAP